jgi:hypothetical protein
MPVMALDVISRVLAASTSSSDNSGVGGLGRLCPGNSCCCLFAEGPPFMLGLLPLPIPGGAC